MDANLSEVTQIEVTINKLAVEFQKSLSWTDTIVRHMKRKNRGKIGNTYGLRSSI